MSESDPTILVAQILHRAQKAATYVEGLDKESFLSDTRTQEAVVLNLLVIGEAASRLSKRHSDFIAKYPEVPWLQMQGMRNRIAHGYSDINMHVVWNAVQEALPEIVLALSKTDISMPVEPKNKDS